MFCQKIASNSVNSSTEKCHYGEVSQLQQDDSQHKTEYITDKEKQTENLTSTTHASSGINYFITYVKRDTPHLEFNYFLYIAGIGHPNITFVYFTIPFNSRKKG